MDTIYALASARGKAGLSVVRISGPQAHEVVRALTGSVPVARRASLRHLRWNGDILDDALVLVFEERASFTGEKVAELQLHGSVATVSAVLTALAEQPGLRIAEPGEFTRRALENGRLDLAQVEGLSDLIEAETEAQRKQALEVFSGAIGTRVGVWREMIVRAAALIEATIDFADEDVPVDVTPEVTDLLGRLLVELRRETSASVARERVRDGFEVAILGAPNAGKSTLLNTLARRDVAITSDIAGTTRDVIEVRMDLKGLPVTFLDTAGLRESQDPIEMTGINRARLRGEAADLRVLLVEEGQDRPTFDLGPDDLVVVGKSDRTPGPGLRVSGETGEGVAELIDAIHERLSKKMPTGGILIRERQRMAVLRAIGFAESAMDEISNGLGRHELAAEELRLAARALDSVVGRVDVEDLLGEIFARFCIGK